MGPSESRPPTASFTSSTEALWPEAMGIDLTRSVPKLQVPVFFVSGRHDFNMPLISRYFEALKAPYKEHVIFENSAHGPCYEEPKRFIALMKQVREVTR